MLIDNYINLNRRRNISGLFFATGSFGTIDGNTTYVKKQENEKTIYKYIGNKIVLKAEFTEENGVILRRDTLENLTDDNIEINSLVSRFVLDGNAYDVYTQYNSWQHESSGEWQRLVTQISACAQGMRTCDGATPMMALNNLYTNKTTVFHLLPNAQWQITAKKSPANEKEIVVVETGFNDRGLRLKAKAHETIELPTVIFFNAENKTDLDAYKLHNWYNNTYPRGKMPVLYNSWLYCFDNIDVDSLLKQVDSAAELGIEAFMVDAGWFGNGDNWSASVGDWVETKESSTGGRLAEISQKVRDKGMIFGLWFEPERANPQSNSVKARPEYYILNYFLDFSNNDAVTFIADEISKQIDELKIGWLKFDFNDSIPYDETGNGFYRYMQGQRRFIEIIKERYPHIYITNCASGGYRMELMQGTMCDSFWLSDNQGSYNGLDIVKNTLKRMPTSLIERWNVQKYSDGFVRHGEKEKVGIMFTCNNGTWDSIINVDDSFTQGFINCGPIGFSCDIDSFPEEYKTKWKEHINNFKKSRDFYLNATARILVDSKDITAIQYADETLTHIEIELFTKTVYASNLIIYPVVDKNCSYIYNDKKFTGAYLNENGIYIDGLKDNCCKNIKLIK
ncbi:MAG: alpha-galactosidase [Ruminococcaceae bacterium]|nr:alpha-galactosidase [Oscillospiraceae bacterium]